MITDPFSYFSIPIVHKDLSPLATEEPSHNIISILSPYSGKSDPRSHRSSEGKGKSLTRSLVLLYPVTPLSAIWIPLSSFIPPIALHLPLLVLLLLLLHSILTTPIFLPILLRPSRRRRKNVLYKRNPRISRAEEYGSHCGWSSKMAA